MPELPDLEVFSSNLNRKLKGKKLVTVQFFRGAVKKGSASKIKNAIEKQVVNKVYREGKELRFAFGKKQLLGLHLMLHGKMEWITTEAPPRHALAVFRFNNELMLAVSDYQRKANFQLNPPLPEVPDALDSTVNIRFWKNALQSKRSVKALLIDQHIIRGIGNAYADEILWAAKISPNSVADKIPLKNVKLLNSSVKKVLRRAVTSIKKASPGIIEGEVRDFLLIHHPKKKISPAGKKIEIITMGGRKTYYTKEQELFT
jgi:formamidopyrimidine-DNA glycosylase